MVRERPGSVSYMGMRRFTYTDCIGERRTFYVHPGGFKIEWEHKGYSDMGSRGVHVPDAWGWNVYPKQRRGRYATESFRSLRAAKAWCDAQTTTNGGTE